MMNNDTTSTSSTTTTNEAIEVVFGQRGDKNGEFSNPTGVAIDANGHIYVAEFYGHRVQVFSSDGDFLYKFGSDGAGDGQLSRPTGTRSTLLLVTH